MDFIQHYFHEGGPLMWPIALCSMALLAFFIERVWTLFVAPQLLDETPPAHRIWTHKHVLPFFQEVPPALGLLGTVTGLVQSFLNAGARLNGDAVAGGLAVACLTTVAGLSVGLSGTILGYICNAMAGQLGVPYDPNASGPSSKAEPTGKPTTSSRTPRLAPAGGPALQAPANPGVANAPTAVKPAAPPTTTAPPKAKTAPRTQAPAKPADKPKPLNVEPETPPAKPKG